jgi:hypothetical protein
MRINEEPGRVAFENDLNNIVFKCKSAEKGDAGKYNFVMRNDLGMDSVPINVIVVDAPGKPDGLTAADITNDSCMLKWNPPKVSIFKNGRRL